MVSVRQQGPPRSQCSTEIQPLVEKYGWGELVAKGQFEQGKALLSVFSTKKEFLDAHTHTSVTDVFRNETATLATLKKYRGEEPMKAVLKYLIQNLCAMLNIGRGLEDTQIDMTCDMIFSEFYWLTVADFKVCFRNGVLGKYGQLYDRIDTMILLDWLNVYTEERASYAVMESESNWKIPAGGTPMPEWFSEKVKELTEKVTAQKDDKPRKAKYGSLESYFVSNYKDPAGVKDALLAAWIEEFDGIGNQEISRDDFLRFKSIKLFNDLTNGRGLEAGISEILKSNTI
jgi:hypothetical protein